MSGDSGLRPHLTEPPFVAETLAWCNKHREENGQPTLAEMPLGKRMDGAMCPCGEATGLHVGKDRYISADVQRQTLYAHWLPLPKAVVLFVNAFDQGKLPQYELPPASDSQFESEASPGGSSDG